MARPRWHWIEGLTQNLRTTMYGTRSFSSLGKANGESNAATGDLSRMAENLLVRLDIDCKLGTNARLGFG